MGQALRPFHRISQQKQSLVRQHEIDWDGLGKGLGAQRRIRTTDTRIFSPAPLIEIIGKMYAMLHPCRVD
jgi:hypothetical protein